MRPRNTNLLATRVKQSIGTLCVDCMHLLALGDQQESIAGCIMQAVEEYERQGMPSGLSKAVGYAVLAHSHKL